MARLEDIKRDAQLAGVLPNCLVSVVDVKWYGSSAVELTYKDHSGNLGHELLYRNREADIHIATDGATGLPWSFDADGDKLRLVSEAFRIRLAYLFDPLLAVHTSIVDPLPHQITAFSRYSRVLESDGSPVRVRTALSLINQALDEVLAEQEGEYDCDTRWAVAWFEQHGHNESQYGSAETLSKAKDTSVEGLVRVGIVAAGGGKVRLKSREQLDPDWDPMSDKRLTVWEVTQHLIRALDKQGETGAAAILRQVGGDYGETARDLAYRLYTTCERKGWAQEALAYNSLVVSWPEITKLAAGMKGEVRQERFL